MMNVKPILGHIGEGEWCQRDGGGIEMRVTFKIWILQHPVEPMRLIAGTLMQTEVHNIIFQMANEFKCPFTV